MGVADAAVAHVVGTHKEQGLRVVVSARTDAHTQTQGSRREGRRKKKEKKKQSEVGKKYSQGRNEEWVVVVPSKV